MNKKISAVLAWEIILAFFITAIGVLWIENQNLKDEETTAYYTSDQSKQINAAKSCTAHAYKGNAKVSGWLVEENHEKFLRIAEKDLVELPQYDGTEEFKNNNSKVKVIDITAQIENKLKKSSEKNLVSIPLKGYLTRCQGVPLASINYQEGIFRSYL